MAEDVVIPVVVENSEVSGIGRVPLPVQRADFILTAAKNESQGPFISAMARIAFDADFVHCAPARQNGKHRGETEFNERSLTEAGACGESLQLRDAALLVNGGLAHLCVVTGAEQHDHCGQVHPKEQSDGCRKSAVDLVVGHSANIQAEEAVNGPPKECRDDRARQHRSESAMAGSPNSVNQHEDAHCQKKHEHEIDGKNQRMYKLWRTTLANE